MEHIFYIFQIDTQIKDILSSVSLALFSFLHLHQSTCLHSEYTHNFTSIILTKVQTWNVQNLFGHILIILIMLIIIIIVIIRTL